MTITKNNDLCFASLLKHPNIDIKKHDGNQEALRYPIHYAIIKDNLSFTQALLDHRDAFPITDPRYDVHYEDGEARPLLQDAAAFSKNDHLFAFLFRRAEEEFDCGICLQTLHTQSFRCPKATCAQKFCLRCLKTFLEETTKNSCPYCKYNNFQYQAKKFIKRAKSLDLLR